VPADESVLFQRRRHDSASPAAWRSW
jgi:hypothetical protein